MGDKRNLHVGFPEVSLAKYAKILVDKGLKVVVVDQIEPETTTNDKKQTKRFQGREIVAILSKGLFTVNSSELSYEA
jgi:DNA mismatch repair ATPase MutS